MPNNIKIRNMKDGEGNIFYPLTNINAVLKDDGDILQIDDYPTENSSNPVSSGSVYDIINVLISGTKANITLTPEVIYKSNSTSVTISATTGSSIPDELSIYDGSTLIKKVENQSTISEVVSLNITDNSKTYRVEAVFGNFTIDGSKSIQARYPIYYGFGASISDVAISDHMYSATTVSAHTYSGTASSDNQYFYILVPSDLSSLSVFTFGGAPFAVDPVSTTTISDVVYKVYKSSYAYNQGTTLNVDAK